MLYRLVLPSPSLTCTSSRSHRLGSKAKYDKFYATNAPSATRTASPNATAMNVTHHPTYVTGDPYSGSLVIDVVILSWTVLIATEEILMTATVASNTYVAVAFSNSQKMTYPNSGLAYVGTPGDGSVSTVLMTGYTTADMHTGPPVLRNG